MGDLARPGQASDDAILALGHEALDDFTSDAGKSHIKALIF